MVFSTDRRQEGAGYSASTGDRAATGFLVDRCHVLTNLHVAYGDTDVVNAPLGQPVARHVVIGVAQSLAGNGIDVAGTPNVQILFTPGAYGEITRAQALDPCR